MIGLIAGLARAADGKNFIPMIVMVAIVGALIGLVTLKATEVPYYIHLPLCMLGVLAWKAGGWGNYFAAFNGHWNRTRTDVRWIDLVGYKLVPFVDTNDFKTNRKRGLICMAIRGAAFSLPLFTYLGIVVHPLGFLLWPFMAIQGAFYWAAYWVKPLVEDKTSLSWARDGGLQVSFAEILTVWFMVDLAMQLVTI
jgi:hypothetical protein